MKRSKTLDLLFNTTYLLFIYGVGALLTLYVQDAYFDIMEAKAGCLDLVMLVTELNDAYDIEITAEELLSENFNSAEAIWALVRRMQEA